MSQVALGTGLLASITFRTPPVGLNITLTPHFPSETDFWEHNDWQLAEERGRNMHQHSAENLGNLFSSFIDLPVQRIEQVVQPTAQQQSAFDNLKKAAQKAGDQTDCERIYLAVILTVVLIMLVSALVVAVVVWRERGRWRARCKGSDILV